MDVLSGPVWVVLAVLVGITALGVLQVLTSSIKRETAMHDLRLRVAELRKEQLARLRRLAEEGHAMPQAPPTTPQEARQRHAA